MWNFPGQPAHVLQPRPAHADGPPADPPVGVAGAPVPALRPVDVRAVIGPGERADGAAPHVAWRPAPALLQRQDAHRSRRAPAPAAAPRDGPVGPVMAVSGVLRADVCAGRHGTDRIPGLPAVTALRTGT